ncbi:hypothetical protein K2173_009035 [Erythroxylum novogranatense]|uniref:GDSL esterase/lipase n=1 Tax=Erythroxylum novogranatense TaxID=1862640 RepID=A0AAV8TW47_9ROSI|nr:hypothetical protein K2173_009035 [Erythroxylum novogranatense]
MGSCMPKLPCYFIFGASYYDNGNNNALVTTAKANYPPYGIDFPGGATGRFCDGRITPDFIAEFLGFRNYIPSFASVRSDQDILKDVNYASGGSGIRNETGMNLGDRISMDEQLRNHQTMVSRIMAILGERNSATEDYLSKCLYSVGGMGANDYTSNYFLPQFYPTSRQYTPDQYASVLIKQFDLQLRALYKLGARKIVVFGIDPLGCDPVVRARAGINGSSCVDVVNNAVQLFNVKLGPLVDELNNGLPGAKFIYVDAFHIYSSLYSGFRVTNASCCEVITGSPTCIPQGTSCPNRGDYFWWDALHP